MRNLLQTPVRSHESGQTLIFFAIMASALFMMMGLAVEGGNVLMQYRKMQAAADMAALVGAQSLPCSPSDSACLNMAVTGACNTAQQNGFGGGLGGASCSAGAANGAFASSSTSVIASVPPVSCSPYDFIDYGNNSTNSACSKNGTRPTAAAAKYYYIEVQVPATFTVPVFNITFPIYAHAVARS